MKASLDKPEVTGWIVPEMLVNSSLSEKNKWILYTFNSYVALLCCQVKH